MREAIAEAAKATAEGKMPFGSVLAGPTGQILFAAHNQCPTAKKRGGAWAM
jgi:tRNA(Arg) A34 adenosine deaminase TadA